VKLMAALGSCVGPGQIVRAALLAAIVGALIACGYLLVRWGRRRFLGRPPEPGQAETIPYAPAIFAGILLSFIG
jgi:Flp pilus assembly protein protease CpaA